jgi:hypothetical protein
MKIRAITAVAVMFGSCIWSKAWGKTNESVGVCIERGAYVAEVDPATMMASRMFGAIGVKIQWHDDRRFCGTPNDQTIAISLSHQTPAERLPGALAYALPYEGVHIEVFYDRIAIAEPDMRTALLAHVLVHEITHILEGVSRHSDRGIMKAHWDADDRAGMLRIPLSFAPQDVVMIHEGLKTRAAHQGRHTLLAQDLSQAVPIVQ